MGTVENSNKNFIFRTLRQQSKKAEGRPNIALADFIAPIATGIQDYMGCFCVSTEFGVKALAEKYEAQLDDYNSIMVKALADRLAEAFAEYLHKEVRTKHWGYLYCNAVIFLIMRSTFHLSISVALQRLRCL